MNIEIGKELIMQNIIIDEEFELLIPKLDKTTFETLENSLLEYGARDAKKCFTSK
jgi:hypothetical protein